MKNKFDRTSVRRLSVLRPPFSNSTFGNSVFRLFLLLAFSCSLYQQVDAQISPRDSLLYSRPKWNGRDAVIHRPGDRPYSLYHLARPYPAVQKPPKEVCSFHTFYTGMWIPTGRDRVLGSHPLLGMDFGKWTNRFLWDMNFELQLGGTSTSYNVINNGTLTTSNLYGGANIGLNVGYSLLTIKKSVVYLTAGIGWTGFVAVQGDDNTSQLSINTFTSSYGLGVQHFGKNGKLVGAALLYNYLDYQNPGGTPMDGNAVTFRLTFGLFE